MKRLIIILLTTTLLLVGCGTQKNLVTIHDTIYKTNTLYKTQYVHDTIKDSSSTKQYTRDSIVYIETIKYKQHYKTTHDTLRLHDTCYLTNTEIQERVVYKNKPLKDSLGVIILIIIAVTIIYISIKEFLNKKLKL